jgi:two-component system, chemotaxis family, CheB/CheR fusion protein
MNGPSHASLNGIHVLIVEDDMDVRYFVSGVLVLAGALVTATAARDTEHTALTADVIVCGLATVEAAGPGFLDRLRRLHSREHREVPVIALLPPGMSEADACAAGVEHHLRRPVDADDLRALVWALSRR